MRTQLPQSPSSKAMEAGSDLPSRPPLNTSTTSSSVLSTSSSTSSTSSSTTKKRKWYKPKLRFNLHKDWIWVGFIRAADTTPTDQGRNQGGKVEGDEWEQLPAYAPPERRRWERMDRSGDNRVFGEDEWVVEPPSFESSRGRRDERGAEPPAYR